MKQKQIKLKKFVMELNFRIQVMDYRFRIGLKEAGLIAFAIAVVQLLIWIVKVKYGGSYPLRALYSLINWSG